MKVYLYAIRDLKSSWMQILEFVNDETAVRGFENAVDRSQDVLFTHRNDFQLYRLGSYDKDTGHIVPEELPVLILDGKDVVG